MASRVKIRPYLRRAVARRYGLRPDGVVHRIECAYCGWPGTMIWHPPGMPVRKRGAVGAEPSRVDIVETTLVYDHVVSLHDGGAHVAENILLACWPCNSSKGPRSLGDWQRWLDSPRGRRSAFWVRFRQYVSSSTAA